MALPSGTQQGGPGGFSVVLRGRTCRKDNEPDSAGLAVLCSRVCRQGRDPGLVLPAAPEPTHRAHGRTHTRAHTGHHHKGRSRGHSTATPLWDHDWGHCRSEHRDLWLNKSYVHFYFALPAFSSLCRKLLSWPLRFSSHSSSLQQLCPAHNKL